jgi:hypothetical protein
MSSLPLKILLGIVLSPLLGCSAEQAAAPGTSEQDSSSAREVSATCKGSDERTLVGIRLGRVCAAPKEPLTGMCASGVLRNGGAGTGEFLCFVSSQGDYFWAFLDWGEALSGSTFRGDHGHAGPERLSQAESVECARLLGLLQLADEPPDEAGVPAHDLISGAIHYKPCSD